MNKYLIITYFLFFLSIQASFCQTKTVSFSIKQPDTLSNSNPFKKFIGEWTLKNNDWTQNWGGKTETIKIPNHHTVITDINTTNSLLQVIDGPEPNGQIFWSYNPNTGEVGHLSSFGSIRAGKGTGTLDKDGNVRLKLTFEGEPETTYRIYNYKWVSADEYHMRSVQYNESDEPTGLFYEGYFVRI